MLISITVVLIVNYYIYVLFSIDFCFYLWIFRASSRHVTYCCWCLAYLGEIHQIQNSHCKLV